MKEIETCAKTHEGKVVSVVGDKLTTTCSEGHRHCHTMAKDAKVTCDGHVSKAADLKAGTCVRVTEKKDDRSVATAVESGKHIPTTASKALRSRLTHRVPASRRPAGFVISRIFPRAAS